MQTLFDGKHYKVVYNTINNDLSTIGYVDLDELSNYFIINKNTNKIEGAALVASQARKIAELLDSLEENPQKELGLEIIKNEITH